MTADPLEALLHRAHASELRPLAFLLKVNPDQLGLSNLARILALQVRRVGSHGLGNILLRRGEGKPYAEILDDAARLHQITPGEAEATELELARTWFQRKWTRSTPPEREALWTSLGLAGDLPERGSDAVAVARGRLGRSFDYAVTGAADLVVHPVGIFTFVAMLMTPVGCLFRLLLPVAFPYLVWRNLKPSPEYIGSVLLEVARIRQRVLHRVTIGVVGSPSTGKDAAIRALFGIETGNISPIAGSTKEVAIQRLPNSTALFLVNTPGMGDVMENVTEEARQVLDHIDVYLYIVNAEGGVQARELSDYRRCVATGKPVLALVNKIDVLRPRDKDGYLADARSKLGASAEHFLPVAFDPLPQLAPGPIGLEAVHGWLAARLTELGKEGSELPPLPGRTPPVAS